MRKIQVIICGWYFDEFDGKTGQTDYIDGWKHINDSNEFIDVFWACHKIPPPIISDNFSCKIFPNVGLEWGAYNQSFEYLKLDSETIVFCIQDDIVVKNWDFITTVVDKLCGSTKVIGNGPAYPWDFDPKEEARLSYWLKTNDTWIDYVREENKHIYDQRLLTFGVRGSFLAMKYKDIEDIGGFDYVDKPLRKGVKDDGTEFWLIDPFGNTSMYLNSYKFTKFFGQHGIKYFSKEYRKSPFMIECGRGQVVTPGERDGKEGELNIPDEMVLKYEILN